MTDVDPQAVTYTPKYLRTNKPVRIKAERALPVLHYHGRIPCLCNRDQDHDDAKEQ